MDENIFYLERDTSKHIIWKQEQKDLIALLYKNGKSINQISKMFGGSLHNTTISKILSEYGIKKRTAAQSHYKDNRDDTIFQEINTPEKAYWLGFIAADGCLHGNYIKITLQSEDENHLIKFRKFLKAYSIKINKEIRIRNGNTFTYSTFSIGCKQMAKDIQKWGITERKSLTLQPPVFLEESLIPHWIRGYYDGDGGISKATNQNRWTMYFNSTETVLNWIHEKLQTSVVPFQQMHEGKLDNVWRLQINGRQQTKNYLDFLYANASSDIYLDRKYLKYLELCSTFQ